MNGAIRYTAADVPPRMQCLATRRDGWACVCCGHSIIGRPYTVPFRKHPDHGGTATLSNLVTLCGSATSPGGCHLLCEQRDREMNARGFWLRSGEDPAVVPVMLASEHGSGVMAWPTADGHWVFEAPAGGAAA